MINAIISDGSQDSSFTFKDLDFASFDSEVAKVKLKEYYANFFINCPMKYNDLKLYFKQDIKISIKFIYEDDFSNYSVINDCSFTLGSVLDEFKDEIIKNDKFKGDKDEKISDNKI